MTVEELQALQGELNILSARPLGSGTKMPSLEMMDAAKGGSPNPDAAMMKMHIRDRIKAMLSLGRRNTEQTANLHKQDILPPHKMAQRNINPRDYGAPLPPNAPQIPRQSQNREWKSLFAIMERWQNQLSQRKRDTRYDFDREKWIEPSPPQLTGRSRNRIAF